MSSFELALPWILTLTSGLVFVSSLAFFLKTTGRGKHEQAEAPVEDIPAILNRIDALKTKLAAGRLDQDKSVSAGASSRRAAREEAERRDAELKRKAQEEASLLADQIGDFSDLLEQWCELAGSHLATAQFNSWKNDLRRLEDRTRKMAEPVSRASDAFDERTANVVSTLLPITDRARADMPKDWQKLDAVIRKMAKGANLALIEPSVGEIYDRKKHRMSGSVDGVGQRVSSGRTTVNRVEVRGLEALNPRAGDKAILLPEVEVKH